MSSFIEMSSPKISASPALLDRNESPLGPPPAALRFIRQSLKELHRYPAGLYDRCREEVAHYFGRRPDEVLVTTGVDEALDLFYALGDSVLLFRPGYSAFEDRAAAGAKTIEWVSLEHNWAMPPADEWVTSNDLAIVASPHNPSGAVYPRELLSALAGRFRYFLADETYIDFSSERSLLSAAVASNLILFRSFSKAFGLAGLRVGCLIGDQSVIHRMESRKQFYTVDTIALAGVIGALTDLDYLRRAVTEVVHHREWLYARLSRIPGLRCWPSQASFLLVSVASEQAARRLEAEFRDSQIVVRQDAGCDLKNHFRISIGTATENRRVVEAVRRCFPHERIS
jgi:histidinol-phosphate aminotransferase